MAGANGLFDAGQVERARSYHRPLYWAAVAGIVLNLTVLAVLSFSALGGRLYALTSGWSWWARALTYSVVVFSLTAAVDLPVSFWAGYVHERDWGLSTQSLGGWLRDRSKRLLIGFVLGTTGVLFVLAAARVWPAGWPLVVAAAAAGAVLTLSFLAPLIVEPLFNRFTPLADSTLVASDRNQWRRLSWKSHLCVDQHPRRWPVRVRY